MTSIDSFPKDNVERVVYLYSCLKLNTNPNSDNILVEVLLIEIDPEKPNKLKIDDNTHNKYYVTFRDLDTVQLGSIWSGNKLLEGRKFNFEEQLTKVNFEFDLNINKPKIIKLNEDTLLKEKMYLPLENIFSPFSMKKYFTFLMSNYCVLESNGKTEVLIDCIQTLHAFYVPARKKLRGDLINENLSITNIINEYFEDFFIEEVDGVETFTVIIKEKLSKKISKEVIIFLANLALNEMTQQKIQNIRESLNDVKLDKSGRPYPSRFPRVVPPHITKLKFEAEGIWLEEGKTFLVTHTNDVTGIKDYPIVAYSTDLKSETIEKPEQENQKKVKKNRNNKNITTTSNPSRQRGEVKQQTDIFVNTDECDFTMISVEKYSDIPNIQYIKKKKETDEGKVSSGDPNSQKTNKVKKFENTEKKPNRAEINDFELILNALDNLTKKYDSILKNVSYVDLNGETSSKYSLLQITSIVSKPVYPSWSNSTYGRELLFLKLQFRNNDKIAYLIDIYKNDSKESFCAFIFITNRQLDKEDIKQVCVAIEKSHGTKKWLTTCNNLILESKSLNHIYTTEFEWQNRFNTEFKSVLKLKK
ncbi:hypothetical protein ABFO60_17100 [Acinetobacter baumannii]